MKKYILIIILLIISVILFFIIFNLKEENKIDFAINNLSEESINVTIILENTNQIEVYKNEMVLLSDEISYFTYNANNANNENKYIITIILKDLNITKSEEVFTDRDRGIVRIRFFENELRIFQEHKD